MTRSRVPVRVHGPWLHRKRWRLDVFVNGERYKRSFATYGAALLAAHEIATGVETTTETGSDHEIGNDP